MSQQEIIPPEKGEKRVGSNRVHNDHGVTDMAEEFAQAFVANGGDGTAAARQAGYTPKYSREMARRLLGNPRVQARIHVLTREKMAATGAWAFEQMIKLARSAKSDFVKFNAAKDILDRAGFKPVDVNINVKANEGSDLDKLQSRIGTLLATLVAQDPNDPLVQGLIERLGGAAQPQLVLEAQEDVPRTHQPVPHSLSSEPEGEPGS